MSLRILGGKYKGHPLFAVKGHHHRPTSSLLRKTVFDILTLYLEEANFLDLCAGTGAMGLEALSRGASHATFVDKSALSTATIQKSAKKLDLHSQIKTYKGDVITTVKKLITQKKQFDIIYFDPPYDLPLYSPVLALIDDSSLLAPDGIFLVEERYPPKLELELDHLYFEKTRKVSSSALHQLKKR